MWGVTVAPHSSAKVEKKDKDWGRHIFVRAGWLTISDSPEYTKAGTPAKKKKGSKKDDGGEGEEGKFNVMPRGGGWFDVTKPDGEPYNETAMREDEAVELAEKLNSELE